MQVEEQSVIVLVLEVASMTGKSSCDRCSHFEEHDYAHPRHHHPHFSVAKIR